MFIEQSKQIHAELNSGTHYSDSAFDPKHPDTARHFVMLECLEGLVRSLPVKTALTLGDDRGRDANFLKRLGLSVTASDLETTKLELAHDRGFIHNFAKVDAEKIQFPNESFDVVICKESFHHFPRPWLCLYEALRVAKYFVALIEPVDLYRGREGSQYPGPENYQDYYERALNYQYRISIREFLKVAWALHLPYVITLGFNDPYSLPLNIDQWQTEKARLDDLGDRGLRQFNLSLVALSKTDVEPPNLTDRHILYRRPKSPFES